MGVSVSQGQIFLLNFLSVMALSPDLVSAKYITHTLQEQLEQNY